MLHLMTVRDLPFMPAFFDRYSERIPREMPLKEGFNAFKPSAIFSNIAALELLGDRVYAPGKWTVKDILQHCIDTERIMMYRALCISRGEATPLPGFDEESYAQHTTAASRLVPDLLAEYESVRQTTEMLMRYMDREMLLREGNANGIRITPLAIGFMVIGHSLHHLGVLEDRYLPLLSSSGQA